VPTREEKRWRCDNAAKTMRKQIKHNRKPDRVRQRLDMPVDLDDIDSYYDLDLPETERVMPRGELERRQGVLAAALAQLEEGQEEQADAAVPSEGTEGARGVVIEVSSGQCRVDLDGREVLCGLRGTLTAEDGGLTNVVAVGDKVLVHVGEDDTGVVEAVLPRRSALARPHVFYGHLRQMIAANVDQLLVMASWRDPAIWPELIDRYLIAAVRNNLLPIICLNKVDLAEDPAACGAALQPYCDAGYQVIFTSVLTGEGVELLREVLCEQITVLAGLSGVGKSSLLNAIEPGLDLPTGEVGGQNRLGRHTTTQVTMRKLAAGSFVVDTPGIRQFGLAGPQRRELASFYPEFAAVAAGCRFADCLHTREPDCAVREAVQRGQIARIRYDNYRKICRGLSE